MGMSHRSGYPLPPNQPWLNDLISVRRAMGPPPLDEGPATDGEAGTAEDLLCRLGAAVGSDGAAAARALAGLDRLMAEARAGAASSEEVCRRPGAVGMIVLAMRRHGGAGRREEDSADADADAVCQSGLAVLARVMALPDPRGGDAVAAGGGISAVIRAMERCGARRDDEDGGTAAPVAAATAHAAEILRRLARTAPRREAIRTEGGCELVVRAMRDGTAQGRGEGRRDLVFHCLAALHNFSVENEHNCYVIGSAGGIPCIFDAVRAHSDDEALVSVACRALHRLSEVGTNRAQIGGGGDAEGWALVQAAGVAKYPKSCGSTVLQIQSNLKRSNP